MKAIAFLLLVSVAEFGSCAKFVYRAQAGEKSTDTQCSVCQLSVTELKSLLQSSAIQTELRTVAEHVCTLLPSELQSTCQQYVDAYYQEMIDYVLQQDALTLCQELHLCQTVTAESLRGKSISVTRVDVRSLIGAFSKAKSGNDECTTCKAFFAAFEKYVTDPTFINTLIHYVTADVCPRVVREFPDCNDFAARYIPLIFSLLQQVSPDAVCGAIGVCPKQAAASVKKTSAAVQDDCVDCQQFVVDAQQLVSDPAEQDKLTDMVVNQFCPLVNTVFPQCATYAQEYVPIGLQLFVGMTPASVCQAIGWCSSAMPSPMNFGKLFSTLLVLMKSHPEGEKVAPSATNDACADCQTFVIDAQRRYADPAEQQKVIDMVVNSVCPAIANVFSDCPAYAQEYIPIGFQYLAGLAPQQVCLAAGFCSSGAPSASASASASAAVLPWHTITAAKKVGDSCNDCEQFAADAQHFYADPQNQQQVIDLVTGSLCPLLSGVFPECVQFAQQQIPNFFIMFEGLDPVTICTYIGLCGSFRPARTPLLNRFTLGASHVRRFQMAPPSPTHSKPAPHKSNDQTCDDCQAFFADLQQYYQDPDNQQKVIDELVNQVCPQIAQQFPECAQILPEYLPLAFQMFQSISPSFICTQLHFCTSSFSFRSLLNKVGTHSLFRTVFASASESKSSVSTSLKDTVCTDCEVVVELVRVALLSNQTVEQLINRIVAVCNVVAEAGRPMCNAMLRAALHELNYTFQQATDKQVCATFFAQCGSPALFTPGARNV